MSRRDPFGSYRARLDALGFRPSRRLGQNFLLDPSLHAWIAGQAAPEHRDLVLEIGVGLGFLTRELLARAGAVVGVEIDRRLATVVREELAGAIGSGALTLVEGDALGPEGLAPEVVGAMRRQRPAGGRLLAVANLPYAAAGPVLAALVLADPPPERAVLLVQHELAERVAAGPGSRTYGGLSALVQSCYRVVRSRRVGPGVFRPRPRVDSAVMVLEADPRQPLHGSSPLERKSFRDFVQRLFRQRRKRLGATVGAAWEAAGRPAGTVAGEVLDRRPEQLGVDELVALWRAGGEAGG